MTAPLPPQPPPKSFAETLKDHLTWVVTGLTIVGVGGITGLVKACGPDDYAVEAVGEFFPQKMSPKQKNTEGAVFVTARQLLPEDGCWTTKDGHYAERMSDMVRYRPEASKKLNELQIVLGDLQYEAAGTIEIQNVGKKALEDLTVELGHRGEFVVDAGGEHKEGDFKDVIPVGKLNSGSKANVAWWSRVARDARWLSEHARVTHKRRQ